MFFSKSTKMGTEQLTAKHSDMMQVSAVYTSEALQLARAVNSWLCISADVEQMNEDVLSFQCCRSFKHCLLFVQSINNLTRFTDPAVDGTINFL